MLEMASTATATATATAMKFEEKRNVISICDHEHEMKTPSEVVEITKGYEHLHLDDDDEIITESSSSASPVSGDEHHNREPLMSKEDWALYWRQIRESEGFEADLYKGCHEWEEPIFSIIVPALLEGYLDEYKKYVEFAIEKQQKKNHIVFERIVKGNLLVCAPCNYFITFEAKDMDDGGRVKTYQTLVILQFPEEDTYVKIFREKPAQC